MGGVPVKHHSKGKVGRRRSHQALQKAPLVPCRTCRAPVLSHRVCAHCGTYQTQRQPAQHGAIPRQQHTAPESPPQEPAAPPNPEEHAENPEAPKETAEEHSPQQQASPEKDSAPSS
ncbi:50S ribosomal protein L32 [Candidatus Parcubacteria bacterium]|nr:MAG: 50S ribosomal protein L32 [Candidatus Parcubacteria bacterium]